MTTTTCAIFVLLFLTLYFLYSAFFKEANDSKKYFVLAIVSLVMMGIMGTYKFTNDLNKMHQSILEQELIREENLMALYPNEVNTIGAHHTANATTYIVELKDGRVLEYGFDGVNPLYLTERREKMDY